MSVAIEFKGSETGSQIEPVALAVFKRSKWCIVAKLTTLDGEPVLGIAVKQQQGTDTTISVPVQVVDYAERHGARWLYWRKDRYPVEMRRILLSRVRKDGYLQRDGEFYIHLSAMEPVLWRQWEYAKRVVNLTAQVEVKPDLNVPKQLVFALEGAANEL